jgi:hypothetical protein
MPQFTPEKFIDFVGNYDPKNPKHRAAFLELAQKVQELQPDLLSDEANWVKVYRTKIEEPAAPGSVVLKVPYYSQRDNYRDASRTCFSSSCAMLLEYMKPGTLRGSKGDDKYVERVFSYGDTTLSNIQLKALESFGLKARFTTTCNFAKLDEQLVKGIPVPIGILHKGPSSAPSGGGHWIIVIGKIVNAKAPGGCYYVVNDPWGDLDNASGTYTSTNGNSLNYSKNMLKARWTVEGDGSGYAILA